jgi:lipopolysaccharide/colanic/teichoic acid biosynthesis glycosyltransferase
MPIVILLILIIGIGIKIEDAGPIFYMAERTGLQGNQFKMFKFRSMKVNAPDIRLADGSTFNSEDDSRVTKMGKFLRKTSIDEIPQLINVLTGDMSFIGPRPDSAFYLPMYTEEELVILNVRPGITGYNQVVSRNTVSTKEKLKNDIYYVEHMSLCFDIKIIFLTIKNILSHKNVYRDENATKEGIYIREKESDKKK